MSNNPQDTIRIIREIVRDEIDNNCETHINHYYHKTKEINLMPLLIGFMLGIMVNDIWNSMDNFED